MDSNRTRVVTVIAVLFGVLAGAGTFAYIQYCGRPEWLSAGAGGLIALPFLLLLILLRKKPRDAAQ
jgi:hypothetical protein